MSVGFGETTNPNADVSYSESRLGSGTWTNNQPAIVDQGMGEPASHNLPSDGYFFPEVFDDFTNFVEYAGLNPTWDGVELGLFDATLASIGIPDTDMLKQIDARPEEAMEDGDGFAEMSPCREKLISDARYPQTTSQVWRISEGERQALARGVSGALAPSAHIKLPSKHALTRYFQSYTDGFHKHYPVLHLPTYSIENSPPELSFALVAVGAQYRFEFSNGLELYNRAKEITWERLSQCRNHTSLSKSTASTYKCECGRPSNVCTIILLMAFSSWMQSPEMHSDALRLQAPLAHALNQDGLCEVEEGNEDNDWNSWIHREYRRRAKLIGFAYLNVHTLIYDTPPLVFADAINLLLPCSASEWAAKTQADWHILRVQHVPPASFRESFRRLLLDPSDVVGKDTCLETSPLALFILLQGLIQRICLAQRSKIPGTTSLRRCDVGTLE